MSFRMIDEDKPKGTVTFETDAIRERGDQEPVHYREDEDKPDCAICGMLATVWTDSESRWETHTMRCV